jgi:hypothetical protein
VMIKKTRGTLVQISNAVAEAQAAIDVFAPGKVLVTASKEEGDFLITGSYEYEKDQWATWIETIFISRKGQPYYDTDLFVGFFKARADWLNASLEIKGYCDKAGKHPSQYKVGDQPLIMNGDVCFMREV